MRTSVRSSAGTELADLACGLAAAATPDEVVRLVVEETPRVCRASTIVLAAQNFRLELEVLAAAPSLELLGGEPRTSLDDHQPLADAAREGKAVWLPSAVEREARYPHLAGWAAEAFCALPLRTPGGILGALGLGFHEQVDFDDRLRATLTELAETIAVSLQRARLFEAEQRLRRRAEAMAERLGRLQTLTAGLAAARGPGDVAEVVVGHGVIELRATAGALYMLSPMGNRLEPLATVDGTNPENISIDNACPETRCLSSRVLVVERNLDRETVAALPLLIKDAVIGVLALRFEAGRELEREELMFVRALGLQCAQALDRALLYEQRSTEARLLQRSLLPPHTPSISGIEIATRYRPFGDGSVVGGDFYDVFPLPDGRWGIVIGDVSGKGVAAASLTSLARYTIRAAAQHEPSPAGVLQLLNDAILYDDLGGRYCTAVFVDLTPHADGASLRIACGGHPPPLVRGREGVFRIKASGSAIGLLPGPQFTVVEQVLRAGEALVLYTDGVTEARSPDGELAGELVERVLATAGGQSAEDFASAIDVAVQRFQGGNMRDDMALVVVSVSGTGREAR